MLWATRQSRAHCRTWAAIPEPDVILYGIVSIEGVPVGAADDVTVIVRVTGIENPVAQYHM